MDGSTRRERGSGASRLDRERRSAGNRTGSDATPATDGDVDVDGDADRRGARATASDDEDDGDATAVPKVEAGVRPEPGPEAFTIDDAFGTLANQRRRFVVYALLDCEEGFELRELSRRVAAWENDKPDDRVTSQERRRVYNALQQFHLPKMDDAGVIDYDAARGTITPTETLGCLERYVDEPISQRRPWGFYYLALGAAGTAGLAIGAAIGVASTLLAALVPLVVTLSALLHVWDSRRQGVGAFAPPQPCEIGPGDDLDGDVTVGW